jgi:hypothetical protein
MGIRRSSLIGIERGSVVEALDLTWAAVHGLSCSGCSGGLGGCFGFLSPIT